MKNRFAQGAIACVGAVIGAGFASGREIVTFFSRYGAHSWWLILISACVMMLLCALCMRVARHCPNGGWCSMYQNKSKTVRFCSQLCVVLLMAVTGGAMVSASGHMVMLLWPSSWAYPIGAVGTLVLAWLLGYGAMKPLSVISGILTAMFLLALILLLSIEPAQPSQEAIIEVPNSLPELSWGTVRAVAYAAMNLTIAIGVVCKCANQSKRRVCRLSAVFGLTLIALLFISNYLYLKHPELNSEAFPVVRLLSSFGRSGFVASVVLLYLAIFTTLVAIVFALRSAVDVHVRSQKASVAITLALPLLVSMVGFAEIVQSLYAPAGLCCMATVFLPLVINYRRVLKERKPQIPLDN